MARRRTLMDRLALWLAGRLARDPATKGMFLQAADRTRARRVVALLDGGRTDAAIRVMLRTMVKWRDGNPIRKENGRA